MNRLTKKLFKNAQTGVFSIQDLSVLLPESDNSRQALIKRAIAQSEIIHIRRGLYCLAPEYRKKKLISSRSRSKFMDRPMSVWNRR